AELGADFGEDDLGSAAADAIDSSQVDAGESPQGSSEGLVTVRPYVLFLLRIGVSWYWRIPPINGLQGRDRFEEPGFMRGDQTLNRVVELEGGIEIEKVLLSPCPGQIAPDLLRRLAAAAVSKSAEPGRITLSSNDGSQDRHACHAGEIGDRAVDLYV